MLQFTEPGFTREHRESTEAVLSSYVRQIVSGIARDRGLDVSTVRGDHTCAALPALRVRLPTAHVLARRCGRQ